MEHLPRILAILTATALQLQLHSQTFESKIDELLKEKYDVSGPGAAVLVSRGEKTLYRKAFGEANLEWDIPMQADSVFEIGSMTKQFTAVAIMMLMEQGKLKLDDTITDFIPDYPTQGHRITIHHLLTHTSGIKSYTKIRALNEISKTDLSPLGLIDFFKDEPMDFTPGEKFKYNNSGYVILGHIIEVASGVSYEEFIENFIFKAVGMTSSQYASHREIVKRRAYGYHDKEGYINRRHISLSIPYAAGSLMSTIDDMHKWQYAVINNLLISKASKNKLFTNYILNDGQKIDYGYGWHIKDKNSIVRFEHGGNIFGFKSMGVYVPSLDIYVVNLSNCDCNSPTEITKMIADIAIDEFSAGE